MFDNIGGKVKALATVLCIIGIVASIILGLMLLSMNILLGLIVAALGSFISWLSSLALYAIGHTAENTDMIVRRLNKRQPEKSDTQTISDSEVHYATKYKKPEGVKTEQVGSWWCSCGASNRDTTNTCSVCFEQRPNKK